jgi:hypothetical protein
MQLFSANGRPAVSQGLDCLSVSVAACLLLQMIERLSHVSMYPCQTEGAFYADCTYVFVQECPHAARAAGRCYTLASRAERQRT